MNNVFLSYKMATLSFVSLQEYFSNVVCPFYTVNFVE